MMQNGMVANPTEYPMNDPTIEARGNQRQPLGIEDSNCRKSANDPMETVITAPETIKSGRLPALSTRLMETVIKLRYK